MTTTIRTIAAFIAVCVLLVTPDLANAKRTQISIADGQWRLNGRDNVSRYTA